MIFGYVPISRKIKQKHLYTTYYRVLISSENYYKIGEVFSMSKGLNWNNPHQVNSECERLALDTKSLKKL